MSTTSLTTYVAPAGISAIPDAEELREAWKLADAMVKTGFLPSSINTPAKAVAIYLKGRELGLPFMQSMGCIHIVDGRPGVSADYELTPKAKLVASIAMNTENHWVEYRIGGRYTFWRGPK